VTGYSPYRGFYHYGTTGVGGLYGGGVHYSGYHSYSPYYGGYYGGGVRYGNLYGGAYRGSGVPFPVVY
jgi:hypothetical protein